MLALFLFLSRLLGQNQFTSLADIQLPSSVVEL